MTESGFSVYWTKTAENDLEAVIDYISDDSVDNALKILYKIKDKAATLDFFPERGRIVPELKFHSILLYREILVKPWRIIYKIDNNMVFVLSVLDGRRNIEDILLERLIQHNC